MRIGIPKEIKTLEKRVAITPAGVLALVGHHHQVYIEKEAGSGSGFTNEEFSSAGAIILDQADAVWETSDMIIKVKEPIDSEFNRMKEGQILFTYLHLAADERMTLNPDPSSLLPLNLFFN